MKVCDYCPAVKMVCKITNLAGGLVTLNCVCVLVCVLFVLLQIIQFEKNVEQLKKKVSSQSRQQQV